MPNPSIKRDALMRAPYVKRWAARRCVWQLPTEGVAGAGPLPGVSETQLGRGEQK